ncbi:MAG TPA: hypothetical protein VLV54_08750, partial [Thermoanaerobaculia bacterium]|nr:hypothetical protein [Thermoanaerobaculia bacterium]
GLEAEVALKQRRVLPGHLQQHLDGAVGLSGAGPYSRVSKISAMVAIDSSQAKGWRKEAE